MGSLPRVLYCRATRRRQRTHTIYVNPPVGSALWRGHRLHCHSFMFILHRAELRRRVLPAAVQFHVLTAFLVMVQQQVTGGREEAPTPQLQAKQGGGGSGPAALTAAATTTLVRPVAVRPALPAGAVAMCQSSSPRATSGGPLRKEFCCGPYSCYPSGACLGGPSAGAA